MLPTLNKSIIIINNVGIWYNSIDLLMNDIVASWIILLLIIVSYEF